MTPVAIVIMVLAILGTVAAMLLAVFIPLARRLRRMLAELGQDVVARGEQAVRGPESASYRGATSQYGRVKGNGALVLTDRHLVFRKLFGAEIEIPRGDIVGARLETWFLRSSVGRPVLVLTTRTDIEVGLLVRDPEAWLALFPARAGSVARA